MGRALEGLVKKRGRPERGGTKEVERRRNGVPAINTTHTHTLTHTGGVGCLSNGGNLDASFVYLKDLHLGLVLFLPFLWPFNCLLCSFVGHFYV